MANEQILDLGRRWTDAELKGDAAALDALLADDFVGIGPRGFVLTRQQWVERYRGRDLKNDAFAWRDVAIRDYGDTVVAVGIQDQRTTYQGNDVSGRFRTTLVCVRQGGDWRIAGWQASGPIPDMPPRQG